MTGNLHTRRRRLGVKRRLTPDFEFSDAASQVFHQFFLICISCRLAAVALRLTQNNNSNNTIKVHSTAKQDHSLLEIEIRQQ